MITAKFAIPELAGKFTSTTPKLYLWFAYFWGDIHTLASSQPVSVYVPPSPDTRFAYPNFPQALVAVPVPPYYGTFTMNLDDAGLGFAAAGVLVLVFGQHDTPDDAISAGYSAFGTAVSEELNSYVQNNGLVAPTPTQVNQIAQSIQNKVTSAVSDHLSDWDKFLTWISQETQDEFIGYSYAFFGPGQLTTPGHIPLNLPPIQNQIQYTFPKATLDIQSDTDPCQSQVEVVHEAMNKVINLTRHLQRLRVELATADPDHKAALKEKITDILKTTLPAAQAALTNAQRGLLHCRLVHGLIPPHVGPRP